jgi:hypothetical protein
MGVKGQDCMPFWTLEEKPAMLPNPSRVAVAVRALHCTVVKCNYGCCGLEPWGVLNNETANSSTALFLPNHTSAYGASAQLLSVNAGDVLDFVMS